MHVLANVIDYLFSSKKTVVYQTFSQKEYYRIVSKLKAASIKYRVATTSNMSSAPVATANDYGTEYKFYVKKEDEDKAMKAIHSKV
ncbi:hypothetical protein EQV77_05025 [Halobacillus fulvus]|nr:hypothetical protein EQV77_05025 [Halobacillus fulvus]